MSVQANIQMCAFCFDVIKERLEEKNSLQTIQKLKQKEPQSSQLVAIFVTWEIKENKNYELRGCIGSFVKKPLIDQLYKYSIQSAFNDQRFDPINLSEINILKVTVSILSDLENAQDCWDWEVGKHGIEIKFKANQKKYSATFLPEVALHYKWDKEETLKHLVRKAGWKRDMKLLNIKLKRYTSSISELTYQQYLQLKEPTQVKPEPALLEKPLEEKKIAPKKQSQCCSLCAVF